MENTHFTKELIKGRIAEIIFEQMFRESGKFTILRFGYEYTTPELAQYQHLVEVRDVLDSIRHTPDFILISQDRKEVHLVEVKYRTRLDSKEISEIAKHTLRRYDPSWLFVASPEGFYFAPCHTVANKGGSIRSLPITWIGADIQKAYLEVLNAFRPPLSEPETFQHSRSAV